jgi:[ribosomal protein S18]-alanine N-acetyltransferase
LYEIEKACFPKGFRWSEKAFTKEIKSAAAKGLFLIAELSGRTGGFLIADEDRGKGHIVTVDIHPIHRRKGIATKLIAVAEAELKKRGLKQVNLEVHTDNPAYILYFGLGYRATAFRRHYYKLNAHAITMTKTL